MHGQYPDDKFSRGAVKTKTCWNEQEIKLKITLHWFEPGSNQNFAENNTKFSWKMQAIFFARMLYYQKSFVDFFSLI